MKSSAVIPVILFAYARPEHVARSLACLKENCVPLLYVFADGAKGSADAAAVRETRALLRRVDWCEVHLIERPENLGLGRNVLAGVTEVAGRHDAFIAWEDDLVCVPGAYDWLCAALRYYADDPRVMSVTAWTHPRVTPLGLHGQPYFDARGECWVWGAWARSWTGMTAQTAGEKMRAAVAAGIAADTVGADLISMATVEQVRNIWAVRWLYHHLQHGGLCLRPPQSMVEHIGFDASATNAAGSTEWANPPLAAAPAIPAIWPEPREHPQCRALWQLAAPAWPSRLARIRIRLVRLLRKVKARCFGWRWFRGSYSSWAEARQHTSAGDGAADLARVRTAARAVRAGTAAWDRDGVAFVASQVHAPLLAALRAAAGAHGGRLDLVDFGGGLGSTWTQHRSALADIECASWRIVERPALMAAGREEFSAAPLSFHESLAGALAAGPAPVILLSSVLPYVEDPYGLLQEVLLSGFEEVIIDRTPLISGESDRIVVQHTPPELGGGSHPCRLFARENLFAPLRGQYELVAEWPVSFDQLDPAVDYRGFHFRRRSSLIHA